jgi:transcriptional regulator with XRE-family HTH domain
MLRKYKVNVVVQNNRFRYNEITIRREDFMMKLSDKIIKHRKSTGWSHEDFAEKLNVSRQAISRWENGTALPDAQNLLQISKLFGVSADYLLNDDYESDNDIPAVKTATEETEALLLRKKRLHLIAAICFTVSSFCALMGVVNSTNDIQFALSIFMLSFCASNVIAQFVLYFKKR